MYSHLVPLIIDIPKLSLKIKNFNPIYQFIGISKDHNEIILKILMMILNLDG